MRRIIAAIAVLAALASVTAFFWTRQTATTSALTTLQHQCDELRSQIDGRDQTITELRSSIERLQHSTLVASPAERTAQPAHSANAELELARRVADLTVLQSNILALVERLAARTADTAPPAESARRAQVALAFLESSLGEHQRRLEASKQRASELLVSLNVPAEVSTIEAAKALDTASLRPYWPFFEAKRERDSFQHVMERLRLRLLQEQIDAGVETQNATRQ